MQILISEEQIRQRVTELGVQITSDYKGCPLTILGVLTGSLVFLADLIRATQIPLRVALIQASSYGGTRTDPGELSINRSLLPDLSDRDVLILDDIFDTGRTMVGLIEALSHCRVRSIRTGVLLWKSSRTVVSLKPDLYGFLIPDHFVVGYGLDYNDEFRHLPFVGVPDENDLKSVTDSSQEKRTR